MTISSTCLIVAYPWIVAGML